MIRAPSVQAHERLWRSEAHALSGQGRDIEAAPLQCEPAASQTARLVKCAPGWTPIVISEDA